MKRLFLYISLAVSIFSIAWVGADFRKVDNRTFKKGEFLRYRIHYGMVTAGFASLEVSPERHVINGRKCHHIVGKGYTNSFFDTFYKVRDKYESFMDEEALISWKFKRHIVEGKFDNYTETHFDHPNGKANYINPEKQVIPYDVPKDIQDVLSAFFYARATNSHEKMKSGDRISLRNFIDRKTFGLQAEMLERENIKVAGTIYKALKMKLMVEESGLVTDGSKIVFWISDDENKVPLRIQSDLMIGSLRADLVEYDGLRHSFDAIVK